MPNASSHTQIKYWKANVWKKQLKMERVQRETNPP